jgi:hypothetical protein
MLLYQKYVAGSKGHPKVLMPHRPFQWPFFPTTFILLFLSAGKRANEEDTHSSLLRSPETNSPARRNNNNAHGTPQTGVDLVVVGEQRRQQQQQQQQKMARSSLLLMLSVLPFFISAQVFFSRFLCSRFCAGVVCGKFVFALLLWGI